MSPVSASAPAISIIVPVVNEAATLGALAEHLPAGIETILVDGGSNDGTYIRAQEYGLSIIQADRGRANQMNAGAAASTGEVLLFLHADTVLPEQLPDLMAGFLSSPSVWGRFDVRLSGSNIAFRMIEFMMNWRSRLTGICTGDQAIFVRRGAFTAIGGFSVIPLMEDIDLSRRLKALSPPYRAAAAVTTSSRRWESQGVLRTVLLMWWLRLSYFLGASPESLARRYYPGRTDE